ncbi:MAG: transcription antitermination factor NusB [Lawsonibacter sp.]
MEERPEKRPCLALNACQKQGGWSDGVLKKQLAAAERTDGMRPWPPSCALACCKTRCCWTFTCPDFSNIPLKRMEGKVVQALRLGAYQMLFLDKIPHSAAVNSSVELAKRHCKNPRAAGMVNGILRALERSLDDLPTIPQGDPTSYLSTLYSHPEWLVKEFLLAIGTGGNRQAAGSR